VQRRALCKSLFLLIIIIIIIIIIFAFMTVIDLALSPAHRRHTVLACVELKVWWSSGKVVTGCTYMQKEGWRRDLCQDT
jgi:uncharacterized membrane protein (DUF106 family)